MMPWRAHRTVHWRDRPVPAPVSRSSTFPCSSASGLARANFRRWRRTRCTETARDIAGKFDPRVRQRLMPGALMSAADCVDLVLLRKRRSSPRPTPTSRFTTRCWPPDFRSFARASPSLRPRRRVFPHQRVCCCNCAPFNVPTRRGVHCRVCGEAPVGLMIIGETHGRQPRAGAVQAIPRSPADRQNLRVFFRRSLRLFLLFLHFFFGGLPLVPADPVGTMASHQTDANIQTAPGPIPGPCCHRADFPRIFMSSRMTPMMTNGDGLLAISVGTNVQQVITIHFTLPSPARRQSGALAGWDAAALAEARESTSRSCSRLATPPVTGAM